MKISQDEKNSIKGKLEEKENESKELIEQN